eukprot:7936-Heterococcus_DN1.PRE.8
MSYFEEDIYRDLDDNPDFSMYDEAKLFAKEIDIAFRKYRAEAGKSVLDHADDDVNRWLEAYVVQRFWESQAGFSYPADITTCEAKLTYTATLDAEYNAEKTSVEVAVEAAASLQVQQCNTEAWLATRVVGATDNHISAGDMRQHHKHTDVPSFCRKHTKSRASRNKALWLNSLLMLGPSSVTYDIHNPIGLSSCRRTPLNQLLSTHRCAAVQHKEAFEAAAELSFRKQGSGAFVCYYRTITQRDAGEERARAQLKVM